MVVIDGPNAVGIQVAGFCLDDEAVDSIFKV